MNRVRHLLGRWLRKLHKDDPRRKILMWATGLAVLCGALELGTPLEEFLRVGRNKINAHPASGQIVVVAIDERSIGKIGRWPWPRRVHGQIADRLREAGARSAYFDLIMAEASNPVDDRAFAEALRKLGAKAVMPTTEIRDRVSGSKVDVMPAAVFRGSSRIANINVWDSVFGQVWRLPYAFESAGKSYPSFSASLAERHGSAGQWYPINHAIEVGSIPTFSAIDVIEGKIAGSLLSGKDVLVGTASERVGDMHVIPGTGLAPGVYLHALGGETLRQGKPLQLGWLPALLFVFGIGSLHLYSRRRSGLALVGTAAALALVPLASERALIFIDIVPALVLFTVVTGAIARIRLKQRSATVNAISGLPNLNALRQASDGTAATLIVAKIHNFPQIASAIPQETEAALVKQIANRFAMGIAGATLYQGEEGLFAWTTEIDRSSNLDDQLEGLHAVLANPVTIGIQSVDLVVTFGLDRSDRMLANRIGSALVAADEAQIEGRRSKTYDPARLVDADWQLSLVGRLERAIDLGEMWVAYQPKIDVRSGRIVGAEALVRWTHPEKGEIAPQDFIPAAEASNRIEKLTMFVLRDAIRVAGAINRRGIDFNIAVNMSTRLLDAKDFDLQIEQALAEGGLDPSLLTLEITETAALNANSQALAMLGRLRNRGIGLSLDDFGTGFSTLEYLRDIPATEIKIDRSFVIGLARSMGDRLMVNSTIQLAHSLGRTVVAEGVEGADVLALLTGMNCDFAQGYHISPPVRVTRLSRMLLGQRRRAA